MRRSMGRGRCAALGCDPLNSSSFHRFPKEPLLREKWVRFCRRGIGFNPESGRICGAHFADQDFEVSAEREHLGPNYNKRRLKRDSVPSLRPKGGGIHNPELYLEAPESGQHFLSGLGVETPINNHDNNSLSNSGGMFDEGPDFALDNASSNGSSSSSTTTTLRRSMRTRYSTREDEVVNTILIDDNSNDSSSRKGGGDEMARGRRSQARKSYFPMPKKGAVFDEKGILIQSGLDLCDCFDQECPGCHFPCNKCKSSKCAHECRVNRRWQFETKEIDGVRGSLQRNPNLHKKAYTSTC